MFSIEWLKKFPISKEIYDLLLERRLKEIDDKHPKKIITYNGRYFPRSNDLISVPIQLFITPHDPYIKNKMIDYRVGVASKCDDDILKIYKYSRTKSWNPYNYKYDKDNFGVPELWLFPFEMRGRPAGFDCDDFAIELATMLITSGVPEKRVRVVAGKTWSGFGHLTVYVLMDDLKTWKHLNSTSSYSSIKSFKKLEDLPNSNDANDTIGIKDVWFSFNSQNAWSDFEGNKTDMGYLKQRGIVIKDDRP